MTSSDDNNKQTPKQHNTGVICLILLLIGIPWALLARQYLLTGPSEKKIPAQQRGKSPADSNSREPSKDLRDFLINSQKSTGWEDFDADPLGLAPPVEAKRIHAVRQNSSHGRVEMAKYTAQLDQAKIEKYYTDKLISMGYKSLDALTDERGRHQISFVRKSSRVEVSLRKIPPDGKIVIIMLTVVCPAGL
ncbi:MAG TPA: hypothetical protein ENL03_02325 [Phycisphaerae bacterium]|nr:hypothetical protein [Phycisphaerae bacterium]